MKMRVLGSGLLSVVALLAQVAPAVAEVDGKSVSAAQVSPSDAVTLMEDIAGRLSSAPVIAGRFEQSKTIHGFKNPLISSGVFIIARDQGIFWHTQLPFESKLTVTPERISSQQDDGAVNTLVGPGGEAALRTVNELLFAIMTANLHVLAERFEIAGQSHQGENWTLDLVPRDAMLRQWLSRVELQGDAYVQKVVLHEKQGDRSVIVLNGHDASQSLRKSDAQRFQ